MSDENVPKMPQAEQTGFIETLNKMGYITSWLDPFSQAFVDYSALVKGPVLEIGAAYGIASIEALKKGAKVIANDIDSRHLDILKQRTPDHMKNHLTLLPGRFPDDLKMDLASIDAALICRVLHFFKGETIQRAAEFFFQCLRPGGKVFVVADSPYLKPFQSFVPTYLARKSARTSWPGLIENLHDLASERAKQLPSFFHCLDPDVLSEVFDQAGFKIEKAEFFAQPQYPEDVRLDGREGVGLIAVKP